MKAGIWTDKLTPRQTLLDMVLATFACDTTAVALLLV